MADRLNGKDIAEFVGIGAIVASLIFVGMQMRQTQEIAIADGYSELASSTYARSDLITSHSVLIAKANRGDQLSDAEAIALGEFVSAMWLSEFFATSRWEVLDRETGGPVAFLSGFFCQNQGLLTIWQDRSSAFLGGFGQVRSQRSGQTARFAKDVDDAIQRRCGK